MARTLTVTPARGWRPIAICPNRELYAELEPLLTPFAAAAVIDLKAYPPRSSLSGLLAGDGPNICFLDVGSNREAAFAILAEVAALDKAIPAIAVHGSSDPDLILRSLRQGASEFLVQPFGAEQLRLALERLARLRRETRVQRRDLGKVYCLMPGKGACGTTTLACNLAFHFKRLGSKKVLLVDFDPLTGTISFLLKLKSSYSFIDALTNSSRMDQDLWKALVTPSQGVDVILSPENPADVSNEAQEVAAMVDYSREIYETIILDTQTPYGEWPLALASLCDELLMVTTNELPALHATQRSLAYLERNRVDRGKIKVIVNRYNRDVGLGREAIETALHADVFHLLPSDYEAVQRALLEGKPVPSGTSLGKSIASLADRLAGHADKPKKGWLFAGLFSRLDGASS